MIDRTLFENKKIAFHTLGCKLNLPKHQLLVNNYQNLGLSSAEQTKRQMLSSLTLVR